MVIDRSKRERESAALGRERAKQPTGTGERGANEGGRREEIEKMR